eukprot:2462897-Rhodomonas_salina.1
MFPGPLLTQNLPTSASRPYLPSSDSEFCTSQALSPTHGIIMSMSTDDLSHGTTAEAEATESSSESPLVCCCCARERASGGSEEASPRGASSVLRLFFHLRRWFQLPRRHRDRLCTACHTPAVT